MNTVDRLVFKIQSLFPPTYSIEAFYLDANGGTRDNSFFKSHFSLALNFSANVEVYKGMISDLSRTDLVDVSTRPHQTDVAN